MVENLLANDISFKFFRIDKFAATPPATTK